MDQLANQIHVPARTLVVFNALNWKRNAFVETDLGEKEGLVDLTTHQPVPVEVLFNKEKFRHVRFLASDIPAVGYKCFGILPKASSSYSPTGISKDPVIENRYYRITIDPRSGLVESVFDKQLQRELVNRHSAYKFGQYLYVTGGMAILRKPLHRSLFFADDAVQRSFHSRQSEKRPEECDFHG